MKHFVFLPFFIIACNGNQSLKVQEKITPEEIQIAKNLIQGSFDDIWAGFDSTKILNYHTEDFIILENGEVWDNERIKAFMRKKIKENRDVNRINKMDYISIEKFGPSIQLAYHNSADFIHADTLAGKGRWLESATAIETPDGWRLKMMHSTWVGNK